MLRSEATYQVKLIKRLKILFPGCHIIKNDPSDTQGIPDLLILYNDKWSALEIKMSATSHRQPNQKHYIDRFSEMSFAAFIYPENEEQVLDELGRVLGRD